MTPLLLSLSLLFPPLTSRAADLQARQCEFYIESVDSDYSSHGIRNMQVVIKTGALANGERVRRVAAYQRVVAHDLGNTSGCHYAKPANPEWHIVDARGGDTIGRSILQFQIATGSVASYCPGYQFSTEVAFFVKTDRNTYWLNPDFNSSNLFVFDLNAFQINLKKGSWTPVSTARDDMRYYNPGHCR